MLRNLIVATLKLRYTENGWGIINFKQWFIRTKLFRLTSSTTASCIYTSY